MDKVLKALVADSQVSLAVIDTTEVIKAAQKIHAPSREGIKILGGLLTAAVYLASSLKQQSDSVSLTVKAQDGDGAISVSCDSALHVRGYIDGSCQSSLVGGTLTVVREDGANLPFVGTCEIDNDDISDLVEKYFGQSEQIATAVALDVRLDGDGVCTYGGGVIMQLLPDAQDEAIDAAGEAFYRYRGEIGALSRADDIMEAYFSKLVSGEVTTTFPEYKCNCSERKIAGVLASVGREELLKICEEQGEVRVHCHYCNRDYVFTRSRIEENF